MGGQNAKPPIAVYRGQSGHSSHKRCLEHMDSIRRGDNSSGMGAHMSEAHPGIDLADPKEVIEMTIIDHRAKNMERGIAEAILIGKTEEGEGRG